MSTDRDLLQRLRDVGTGAIPHTRDNDCPVDHFGFDNTGVTREHREDGCPACAVLREADTVIARPSASAMTKPLRLGVAVVVTMLPYSDAGIQILWGKRLGAHGAGTWAFPGGEVQPGESVVEAAARELREETGIDVPVSDVEMIHHAQPVEHPNGERWVCLICTVRVHRETVAQVLEPEKCEAWTWRLRRDRPSPLFASSQVQISDGVLDDLELLG